MTVVSYGVSLVTIRKHVQRIGHSNNGELHQSSIKKAHYSAKTVVLFVSVYVILNVPYAVVYIYVQVVSSLKSIPPPKVILDVDVEIFLFYFTHVLSISTNAALNPLLYYWRIREFRDHVHLTFFNEIKEFARTLLTKLNINQSGTVG